MIFEIWVVAVLHGFKLNHWCPKSALGSSSPFAECRQPQVRYQMYGQWTSHQIATCQQRMDGRGSRNWKKSLCACPKVGAP